MASGQSFVFSISNTKCPWTLGQNNCSIFQFCLHYTSIQTLIKISVRCDTDQRSGYVNMLNDKEKYNFFPMYESVLNWNIALRLRSEISHYKLLFKVQNSIGLVHMLKLDSGNVSSNICITTVSSNRNHHCTQQCVITSVYIYLWPMARQSIVTEIR